MTQPRLLSQYVAVDWLRLQASRIPADQAIVELGVYQGGSLRYLLDGAAAGHQPPVFGVDAWDTVRYEGRDLTIDPFPRLAFTMADNEKIAREHCPEAHFIKGFSVEAAQKYDGPPIGLLYHDADHTYDAVLKDIGAWERHLAPGAVVAFDDYWAKWSWLGVIEAVKQLVDTGRLVDFALVGKRLATAKVPS